MLDFNRTPDTKAIPKIDKPLPVCLDLGAGHNPVRLISHLVVTVDSRKDMNPTVLTDLRALPFDDNSVDAVFSSHVLEHFAYREILPVLKEWVRVIRPGGDIWITVPDISFACKKILKDEYDWDTFAIFYGEQEYELNFHKMGFTEKALHKFMEQLPLDGHIGSTGREVVYEGIKLP